MSVEIERKFLVIHDGWRDAVIRRHTISQAYLSTNSSNSQRVRLVDKNSAWLTIKSKYCGLARQEFEYPIPYEDGLQLLEMRQSGIIEKTRHILDFGGLTWEVDEFAAQNQGLIIAEVELTDEAEKVQRPDWAGLEVTGQKRYHNSRLAIRPFQAWVHHATDLIAAE